MAEFIGARISLISKSDIRYVGTLHEINSDQSTVSLETVTSFGTEGRRGNPDDEVEPSDNVYDYIVFRGSDVKDLRIEEVATTKENKPPQVPDDPAILGSGSRPVPQSQGSHRQGQQATSQQGPPPSGSQGPHGPPFPQPQYQPFYPPPPQGWGRGGPPGPGGFPGMPPYGAPPGWYPPPGQQFPPHPPGPFPPYGYPPAGQFGQPPPPHQQHPGQKPAPIGPGAKQHGTSSEAEKPAEPKSLAKPAEMAAAAVPKLSQASVTSKPSPTEEKSVIDTKSDSQSIPAPGAAGKSAPTAPKGRVQPAVPLSSPAAPKATPQKKPGASLPSTQPNTLANLTDATKAATTAVAAALAKLPPAQTNGSAMDNLTRKVNEMRTSDPIRGPRHPDGSSGGFERGRGGSRGRGGPRNLAAGQKVELPATDFDFESSNAKFNKQDLVKEAIAGSPLEEQPPAASPEALVPAGGYNKTTSFFDNISSESRDRAEAANGGTRPGGPAWRGEEQKKNVETFGQGSVDNNGYRGGYRGRGRGRGRGGFRGRGYAGSGTPSRGGGGYRGDRGTAAQ